MIEFTGVTKRYPGGRDALSNVSFRIAAGEFVYLTGHSGAGKSTIFKLIAGIERPTAGIVVVNGHNIGRMGERSVPFFRRQLGLVLQDHRLLFDRSVFDNVMLPLQVSGMEPLEARRRARAALDKVGLSGREKANPIALSGGEQQRICLARAVVNRPAVVIADEPTASLDAGHADRILTIFVDFHRVGVTVMIATHDDSLPARFPGRELKLEQGALTA
jgi:cell division transport system ATP-binding protein